VTEARLAIALARMGGLGIIHRNLTPEDQAAEVDKVKRSQSGMIVEPITLRHDNTLQDAEDIMSHYHISGVPITNPDDKLVGILTNRDIRFVQESDYRLPVKDFMTPEDKIVSAHVGIGLEEAKTILQKHRIEKLPIVDDANILKGLITVKDIQKAKDFPNAAIDSQKRLLAGAAVGVGENALTRVGLMVKAGLDVVAIDTAHGHSAAVIETIKAIHAAWPDLPIIAGNVVTAEGTLAMIEAGASAVKVGVGAGSICTTRIVAGAGMPQLSAIYNCAKAAAPHNIPIIADGGIKYSGDITKSLAVGAHLVMVGSLLAGLEEAPGEVILYEGRRFKDYRGMGSVGAMKGHGKDRYASASASSANDSGKHVPEGIEGRVPYKGYTADYINQMIGGLRSGMGYAGASNLEELRTQTELVRITNAGMIESHPHDVIMTKEPPNYQLPS
ncbi:MAG TPA: IMP dehydrogenase, partial [Anaerolineales bacterium]|nr:IMP dehydrogenase [Anaerolineales bacterium]